MDHTGDRPTVTRPTGRSWVHVCERCGEPIAEKRLEALPFARYCIECQRRLEREDKAAAG